MKKHVYAVACLAIAGMAQPAHARPVSYPGGWTVMQMNDMNTHSLHVHYSPTAKTSVGYLAEYWRKNDWQFHGVQVNNLLKRWNMPQAQANLYLKSGLGVAFSDYESLEDETSPAGFLGIAGDWENRRFFTSYEARYVEAGDIDHFFMQKGRVGVAPYVGDYGDLHTWLMLQVDHNPTREDEEVTVTPMVRLFKDVYMAEFGVSHRGDVMANWVVRF